MLLLVIACVAFWHAFDTGRLAGRGSKATERERDVALAVDGTSVEPRRADEAANRETIRATPSLDRAASTTTRAEPAFACGSYDVIDAVVASVGGLDAERCLRSLQLNPRCMMLPADVAERVRTRLAGYSEEDRMIAHRTAVAMSDEVRRMVEAGLAPEM
ncbi:MAG: hypothetical protein KAI24_25445, partial [Planctomycetes bacterium]|nr:hypothetical protein [Planctomycetota bacterium]